MFYCATFFFYATYTDQLLTQHAAGIISWPRLGDSGWMYVGRRFVGKYPRHGHGYSYGYGDGYGYAFGYGLTITITIDKSQPPLSTSVPLSRYEARDKEQRQLSYREVHTYLDTYLPTYTYLPIATWMYLPCLDIGMLEC